MKTLAFVIGLCIATFGAVGIVAPSSLVWITQHAVTTGIFLLIGTVRFALGLVLISVASSSRSPKALRVLGCIILIAGITSIFMALFGIQRAKEMTEWWVQQGPVVFRLTAVAVMVLGGFIAYACFPVRRVL